jgi:hypothetical protein
MAVACVLPWAAALTLVMLEIITVVDQIKCRRCNWLMLCVADGAVQLNHTARYPGQLASCSCSCHTVSICNMSSSDACLPGCVFVCARVSLLHTLTDFRADSLHIWSLVAFVAPMLAVFFPSPYPFGKCSMQAIKRRLHGGQWHALCTIGWKLGIREGLQRHSCKSLCDVALASGGTSYYGVLGAYDAGLVILCCLAWG